MEGNNSGLTPEQKLFGERLERVNTAIALGVPDRVPCFCYVSSYMQRLYGSSYADIYYDFEKAGQAAVQFYRDYPMMDIGNVPTFTSGRANEIAGTDRIDWPGRPGSIVSKYSSHQVIEREMMLPEEYPELLSDFTGFMLRKYLPRAYKNLGGASGLRLIPTVVLSTGMLSPFYSKKAADFYAKLAEIAAEDAKAGAAAAKYRKIIAEMGFPPMSSGISEAPYDILGDYFRGTMGIFEDICDEDTADYIDRVCDMFADQQIEALQYLHFIDMPVKRVFFPLHKAMDGFMNDRQFERFYWKPLKKIMLALIEMGVTPYIYTEGPYNSRLEYLADVPKGKVLYHFETVDMARAKKILAGTAAICGNLSATELEFGKKETVINDVRRLLDTCMPDGGYLFDFNALLENANKENFDAMFETLDKYGRY